MNGFRWGLVLVQSEAEIKVKSIAASGKKRDSIDFLYSSFPNKSS